VGIFQIFIDPLAHLPELMVKSGKMTVLHSISYECAEPDYHDQRFPVFLQGGGKI
jgi:hypothetical protein